LHQTFAFLFKALERFGARIANSGSGRPHDIAAAIGHTATACSAAAAAPHRVARPENGQGSLPRIGVQPFQKMGRGANKNGHGFTTEIWANNLIHFVDATITFLLRDRKMGRFLCPAFGFKKCAVFGLAAKCGTIVVIFLVVTWASGGWQQLQTTAFGFGEVFSIDVRFC
jgi:hypothetical protein